MSIFHTATIACPDCGLSSDVSWSASVNADRRPDLRDAILDGSFQSESCPHCSRKLRLPPHLTYVDMTRGQWLVAASAAELTQWPVLEADAVKLFDASFGAGAPAAARSLAEGVRPRLVFGWPALREKLLCGELGLNDVDLELLKLALLRGASGIPIGDGLALRLEGGDAGMLTFAVIREETEERVAASEIPRELYDDIAADTATWAAQREQLAGHPFVDTLRFMIGA